MMQFTEYYTSIVKDINVGRSNWVDVALFDMGYRISNYYSLVGEREWTKEGKQPMQVRHNEFCFQMRLPRDMNELKTFCDR